MESFLLFLEQQANLLNNSIILCIPPLIFLFFLFKWIFTTPITTTENQPPSPPKLPLIGNFHQLGKLPHQSLSFLSQIHGPLMLLHLGSMPVLVLSSSDIVSHVTKNHDITFSNRPPLKIARKLLYDLKDVVIAPYGEKWRQLKSMFVVQLLSNRRVHSFRALREEETDLMMKKIRQSSSSSPVDLSDLLLTLTTDVVWRAAYGRKYNLTNKNHGELKKLFGELLELLGAFNLGNFMPWLAWVDHISGLNRRVNRVARELDDFLEEVVEDRMAVLGRQSEGDEAFVDTLLRIQQDKSLGFSLDRDTIKGLLLDIYSAGSDTTATVLEWAMAELLKHPDVMKKLQRDVREILDGKKVINEADTEKMQYLKVVLKETLRLHPPIPIFLRSVLNDVEVKGYKIASGTVVFVNAWCIGRDKMRWDKPNEFLPERFFNSSLEFKGQDLGIIPFGFGRRGCPGMSFAMATIELALANLMQKFDWELPNGMKTEDLDMTESPGITARKRIPLKAVAIPIS